jgi:outer membrane protein OmpA-like peptidoglycan-associated protein
MMTQSFLLTTSTCRPTMRHLRLLFPAVLLALGACAPMSHPGALSPIGARVTNEVIASDAMTLENWVRRAQALRESPASAPGSARVYAAARAAAWASWARDAYNVDPRDGTADQALAVARRLVVALERDSMPLDAELSLTSGEHTRQDLWIALDNARHGSAVTASPVALADAELALVRASHFSTVFVADGERVQGMTAVERACEADMQTRRAMQLIAAMRPPAPAPLVVALQAQPMLPTVVPAPVDPRVFTSGSLNALKAVVHFAVGSSELARESRKTLDEVIVKLRTHPGVNVVLEGFTDPRGDSARNRALAVRRGEAVREFLETANLELGRVSVAGIGTEASAARHSTAAMFARDRRVTLAFTDTTGAPLTVEAFRSYDVDHDRDLQLESTARRSLTTRRMPSSARSRTR